MGGRPTKTQGGRMHGSLTRRLVDFNAGDDLKQSKCILMFLFNAKKKKAGHKPKVDSSFAFRHCAAGCNTGCSGTKEIRAMGAVLPSKLGGFGFRPIFLTPGWWCGQPSLAFRLWRGYRLSVDYCE